MDETLRSRIRLVLEEVVCSELRVIVSKLYDLQQQTELSRLRTEARREAYLLERSSASNVQLLLR